MTGAALLGAGLIVAACSGSDSGAPSTPDSTAEEAPTEEAGETAPVRVQEDEVGASADEPVVSAPVTDPSPATDPEVPAERYATEDASVLFDPDVIHTFDIDLDDSALDELESDPAAEEYVEGSLTFGGETIDRVGVRYKGSVGAFLGCTSGPNPFVPSGEKTCTKLSLKLKINWDGADTEFYGQRRVQLHAMNLDGSLLRERLGYQMFRDAGVPAPRATHVRVNINGDFIGLFAIVEQIDGRFTRDRFDDGGGNLYKEVWPFDDSGRVTDGGALIDALETNEDEDPTAETMLTFAQELLDSDAATNPGAAREVLSQRTDLDALIGYAVVDRAIRHDDGPFHWYCVEGPCEPHNFYLYEEPGTDRVHIIPWDLDNAFYLTHPVTEIADPWGDIQNDCDPFPFGPLAILQRSASCDPFVAAWSSLDMEFTAADQAFRAGPFAPDNVRALLEEWTEQIEPVVEEAAEMHDDAPTVPEWRLAVEQLINDFVVPQEQEN